MKTFTIELRVDDGTPEQMETYQTATCMVARTLLTTAMLVGGKRKPEVCVHSSDFIAGTEEISIYEGEDHG